MRRARTIEIKVAQVFDVPKEDNCSGCGYKDGDVYCSVFRKVIHLDNRYRNRVPVPECFKARKVAERKKAARKVARKVTG